VLSARSVIAFLCVGLNAVRGPVERRGLIRSNRSGSRQFAGFRIDLVAWSNSDPAAALRLLVANPVASTAYTLTLARLAIPIMVLNRSESSGGTEKPSVKYISVLRPGKSILFLDQGKQREKWSRGPCWLRSRRLRELDHVERHLRHGRRGPAAAVFGAPFAIRWNGLRRPRFGQPPLLVRWQSDPTLPYRAQKSVVVGAVDGILYCFFVGGVLQQNAEPLVNGEDAKEQVRTGLILCQLLCRLPGQVPSVRPPALGRPGLPNGSGEGDPSRLQRWLPVGRAFKTWGLWLPPLPHQTERLQLLRRAHRR